MLAFGGSGRIRMEQGGNVDVAPCDVDVGR